MQGLTCDSKRLKGCSPSKRSNFGSAAEMSAPESGRADVSHVPLTDKIRIEMVGAGSVVATCFMVDR